MSSEQQIQSSLPEKDNEIQNKEPKRVLTPELSPQQSNLEEKMKEDNLNHQNDLDQLTHEKKKEEAEKDELHSLREVNQLPFKNSKPIQSTNSSNKPSKIKELHSTTQKDEQNSSHHSNLIQKQKLPKENNQTSIKNPKHVEPQISSQRQADLTKLSKNIDPKHKNQQQDDQINEPEEQKKDIEGQLKRAHQISSKNPKRIQSTAIINRSSQMNDQKIKKDNLPHSNDTVEKPLHSKEENQSVIKAPKNHGQVLHPSQKPKALENSTKNKDLNNDNQSHAIQEQKKDTQDNVDHQSIQTNQSSSQTPQRIQSAISSKRADKNKELDHKIKKNEQKEVFPEEEFCDSLQVFKINFNKIKQQSQQITSFSNELKKYKGTEVKLEILSSFECDNSLFNFSTLFIPLCERVKYLVWVVEGEINDNSGGKELGNIIGKIKKLHNLDINLRYQFFSNIATIQIAASLKNLKHLHSFKISIEEQKAKNLKEESFQKIQDSLSLLPHLEIFKHNFYGKISKQLENLSNFDHSIKDTVYEKFGPRGNTPDVWENAMKEFTFNLEKRANTITEVQLTGYKLIDEERVNNKHFQQTAIDGFDNNLQNHYQEQLNKIFQLNYLTSFIPDGEERGKRSVDHTRKEIKSTLDLLLKLTQERKNQISRIIMLRKMCLQFIPFNPQSVILDMYLE